MSNLQQKIQHLLMDAGYGKQRMNVEGDRLSSLPDDLIHKILSFLPIAKAIETSGLSSRWRSLWISMPYLNFSTDDFSTLPKFSKFVTHVLSRRNHLSDVYSVKLKFHGKATQAFVKQILNYAFSHNIQQLNVEWLHDEKDNELTPFSVFSSRSLKHLSLTMTPRDIRVYDISYLSPTWELPTLTTLDLRSVTWRDDNADECIGVFSKFANLKNLTLKVFTTTGSNDFSIVHPRLTNLTLENCFYGVKVVNVTAPQLENLTIENCYVELVISAPKLASFFYKGYSHLHLSTEGFLSLEKADICFSIPNAKVKKAHQIVSLLQQLHNVKFLTLNLEIVESLSSSEDLILPQSSPFVNLKSLKIYPKVLWWKEAHGNASMSTRLKSYFLDGSKGCTFTLVLRQEIQAQNLMAKLRVLLKKNEDVEKEKMPVASPEQNELEIGGKMAQRENRWDNLDVQYKRTKDKACFIISKLQDIKELLSELPAANRAKIQPCFSSLCVEADIAISKISKVANCMKIKCDENQSHLSLCIHELATTLEPSS